METVVRYDATRSLGHVTLTAARGRRLAVPASVGLIETSGGQEDVQSFSWESAEALRGALRHAHVVAACELLTAYQVRRLWKGEGQDLFLSQYVLLDRLGEGGMGEVFRARHTRLGRDVALKVMRKEKMAKPEAVKRFRREIQLAAQLQHPHIVPLLSAGEAERWRDSPAKLLERQLAQVTPANS